MSIPIKPPFPTVVPCQLPSTLRPCRTWASTPPVMPWKWSSMAERWDVPVRRRTVFGNEDHDILWYIYIIIILFSIMFPIRSTGWKRITGCVPHQTMIGALKLLRVTEREACLTGASICSWAFRKVGFVVEFLTLKIDIWQDTHWSIDCSHLRWPTWNDQPMVTLNQPDDSVKISALDRGQVLIRNANGKAMFVLSLVTYWFHPCICLLPCVGIWILTARTFKVRGSSILLHS